MDRVLRDAWQTANDGFERFLFEAKKTAERIDRRYSVSHRLSSVASAAADRARVIDRDFEIGLKYRNFTSDFVRNWPQVGSFFLLLFPFSFEFYVSLSNNNSRHGNSNFIVVLWCFWLVLQYRTQLSKFLDSPIGKSFSVSIDPFLSICFYWLHV